MTPAAPMTPDAQVILVDLTTPDARDIPNIRMSLVARRVTRPGAPTARQFPLRLRPIGLSDKDVVSRGVAPT